MHLPVFSSGWIAGKLPIIYGYLSHYLMYTVFNTREIQVKNPCEEYPTIYSLASLSDIKEWKVSRIQARYLHKKVYEDEESHVWFNKHKNSESILLFARRKVDLGKNDLPPFVTSTSIGEFIQDADDLVVQIKIECARAEQVLPKLLFCSKQIKGHMNDKSVLFDRLKSNGTTTIIKDIRKIQEETKVNWNKKKILYPAVIAILNKSKPCAIASLYGGILKQIYKARSVIYAKDIWQEFIISLWKQWNKDQDFSLYLLIF